MERLPEGNAGTAGRKGQGCDMKTYIKITEPDGDDENAFVTTLEKAQELLRQMIRAAEDCGEPQGYTFTTSEMDEKDFGALPEFEGF